MAIRKKTTAESETLRADESVKKAQKSSRGRTTAAAEASSISDNKTVKTQSPAAATHKASARKSVPVAPATETPSELAGGEKTKFDIAAHHEEIRIEAYHNWVRNGYPQGSEHHDWITAIEVVRARYEK